MPGIGGLKLPGKTDRKLPVTINKALLNAHIIKDCPEIKSDNKVAILYPQSISCVAYS